MKKLILAALLAVSFAAQAEESLPFLPQVSGPSVVLNGKQYFKPASQTALARSEDSLGTATETSTEPFTLHRGDVLVSPNQLHPATVSGHVLLQLANPADEAAIARGFGLTVKFRTLSTVAYEAPASVELLDLQRRLTADKRIRQVQLELVKNEAYPQ